MAVDSGVEVRQQPVSLAQFAGLLRALCEKNRMRILCFLMQGERSVCDLAKCLDLPQNLVSHHLNVLRELDLVIAHRDEHDARWVYYSVNRAALAELNAVYASFFAAERAEPWRMGCCTDADCCLKCLATGAC